MNAFPAEDLMFNEARFNDLIRAVFRTHQGQTVADEEYLLCEPWSLDPERNSRRHKQVSMLRRQRTILTSPWRGPRHWALGQGWWRQMGRSQGNKGRDNRSRMVGKLVPSRYQLVHLVSELLKRKTPLQGFCHVVLSLPPVFFLFFCLQQKQFYSWLVRAKSTCLKEMSAVPEEVEIVEVHWVDRACSLKPCFQGKTIRWIPQRRLWLEAEAHWSTQ